MVGLLVTFTKNQVYCVLDYETYSEAPLRGSKAVGSFEYSMHPSTEIICAAWRIGTRETLRTAPTRIWSPDESGPISYFSELLETFLTPSIIMVAHNALFEQVITRNVFCRHHMYTMEKKLNAVLGPERWLCTASLASALTLPRKLEEAAKALGLAVQKDMEGHRLMLKYCKPRKPSKNNPATRWTDPDELARIVQYCETDIATEVELFLKTPPLSNAERDLWVLDQKINLRGYQIDRDLVTVVLAMIDKESKNLDRRCHQLSDGDIRSATQTAKVLRYVNDRGSTMLNLQKKTVENELARYSGDPEIDEMLLLRQASGKTSTAKYQAFKNRSAHDGRVRDNFIYHGASTGRWAGTGVQVQNLPRSSVKDTDQATEIVKTGDLEWVRTIYGEPMKVFSDCLRSVIVASPGKVLDVGDFAGIEARVLFWVSNHEKGLEAFREGRDLYRELAARIFNAKLETVTHDQRFVGKTAILGCGFGMGFKKFSAQCQAMGQAVSEQVAKESVSAYRDQHAPVAALWKKLEMAAIAAVQRPGCKYTINHTKWWTNRGILWCELPSSRRLAYYGAQVLFEEKWGEKRPVLYHYGVNPVTKKWGLDKTWGGTITENVVQAIARDLMAAAMIRLERCGCEIVMHVHDEIVGECQIDRSSAPDFLALMALVPEWADGLPIKVEGWRGERYRK